MTNLQKYKNLRTEFDTYKESMNKQWFEQVDKYNHLSYESEMLKREITNLENNILAYFKKS